MVIRFAGNEWGERSQYLEFSRRYRRIDRGLIGIPCHSPHRLSANTAGEETGCPVKSNRFSPRAGALLLTADRPPREAPSRRQSSLHRIAHLELGLATSVLRNIHGHAPVLGSSFLSGVVSDCALLILGLRAKVIRGNPFPNQLGHNCVRAPSGES